MIEALEMDLGALGAPHVLIERIHGLYQAYAALLDEAIAASFVSEYRDENGERVFEALWLFSEHFAMEAKLLGEAEDQFDFVPHKDSVRHVIVRKKDFDLATAQPQSRMAVDVWFTDQRYGVLKATGENCTALARLVKERMLPNALNGIPE